MKKSLLTIGAVVAFAAGASAQGSLSLLGNVLFNTVSSSSSATSGFYSGNLTLEIYTIAAAGNSTLANTINVDEQSKSSVIAGVGLIQSDFTLQQIAPPSGGSQGSNTLVTVSGGTLLDTQQGDYSVGTASSLPQTTSGGVDIYYALVFLNGTGNLEGGVVLDNPAGGYGPATSPPNASSAEWPIFAGSNQNILLQSVPEPATLALAGLGGLSILFLRRRKA
jgi:hypothetical protein